MKLILKTMFLCLLVGCLPPDTNYPKELEEYHSLLEDGSPISGDRLTGWLGEPELISK